MVGGEVHRALQALVYGERLGMEKEAVVHDDRVKLVSLPEAADPAEELSAAPGGEVEGFVEGQGLAPWSQRRQ